MKTNLWRQLLACSPSEAAEAQRMKAKASILQKSLGLQAKQINPN